MSTTEVDYAISILDTEGSPLFEYNSLALFETMSGIKSILGTLALNVAYENEHTVDQTTLTITNKYDSNGSSILKHHLISGAARSMTIEEILRYNLVESDCVASNVLIDYIGGSIEVNRRIKQELGLVGIELVTDRINFNGVDHDDIPFQVGRGTMRDFASYYRLLWSDEKKDLPLEHAWHKELHRNVRKARLFGVQKKDLPISIDWIHKTGSGEDVRPGYLYSTMMDAGELKLDGRILYVAGAMTVKHKGSDMPSREQLVSDFATKNMKALASV
jgi:beta-lactamase class A